MIKCFVTAYSGRLGAAKLSAGTEQLHLSEFSRLPWHSRIAQISRGHIIGKPYTKLRCVVLVTQVAPLTAMILMFPSG